MNKKCSGFSLVEVMAAIVILTIAFFPISNYFTNSIGHISQSEVLSQSHDIVNNTIEELKTGEYKTQSDLDNLESEIESNLSSNYTLYADDYDLEMTLKYLDQNLIEYNDFTNIDQTTDVYLNDIRLVVIDISWNNGNNNYSVETFLRVG